VQSTDIAWPAGFSAPSNLLMVGSVGPTGQISSFSNTPGEACILVNSACEEQNKLKYRFLVAPGELILVENNHNSTTRMTGTSFAAPLVTGTISLVQTRWPWLVNYADETVQIILQSARDMGHPGVDPVYGWGMLDSEAAMSPLSFDNFTVFQAYTYNGKPIAVDRTHPTWTPSALKAAMLTSGQLSAWEKQKAYLVAYENIGTTYRDFLIPLSSALVGKTQSVNGATRPFQSYIYQRLLGWANKMPPPNTAAHMSKRLRSKMKTMLLLR
jgi:subtilisin family serine protease